KTAFFKSSFAVLLDIFVNFGAIYRQLSFKSLQLRHFIWCNCTYAAKFQPIYCGILPKIEFVVFLPIFD
ncbi:MAG: hypothetical protein NC192_08720, partial [Muribaculaceae bacterium]|nr:hypothetical protein [Muribaculaceae bacterium]